MYGVTGPRSFEIRVAPGGPWWRPVGVHPEMTPDCLHELHVTLDRPGRCSILAVGSGSLCGKLPRDRRSGQQHTPEGTYDEARG